METKQKREKTHKYVLTKEKKEAIHIEIMHFLLHNKMEEKSKSMCSFLFGLKGKKNKSGIEKVK